MMVAILLIATIIFYTNNFSLHIIVCKQLAIILTCESIKECNYFAYVTIVKVNTHFVLAHCLNSLFEGILCTIVEIRRSKGNIT